MYQKLLRLEPWTAAPTPVPRLKRDDGCQDKRKRRRVPAQ